MEFWATIAENVLSKQPARSSSAAGAPWSFSRRALRTNRRVVHCAEKPEFVWWPLPMPPAFCTESAPDQCRSIPHENSPSTPSITLDSCIPAKASLVDTLDCAAVFVSWEARLGPSGELPRHTWSSYPSWQDLNAVFQPCHYGQSRIPESLLAIVCTPRSAYFTHTQSNARGRLRPTSSRSPRSP